MFIRSKPYPGMDKDKIFFSHNIGNKGERGLTVAGYTNGDTMQFGVGIKMATEVCYDRAEGRNRSGRRAKYTPYASLKIQGDRRSFKGAAADLFYMEVERVKDCFANACVCPFSFSVFVDAFRLPKKNKKVGKGV